MMSSSTAILQLTRNWPVTKQAAGGSAAVAVANTRRAGPDVSSERPPPAGGAASFAGAAVDVFSVEPLPVDHPFRKLDNLVLTPHLGYVTQETFIAHYTQMVEGIDGWFKGEPVRKLA